MYLYPSGRDECRDKFVQAETTTLLVSTQVCSLPDTSAIGVSRLASSSSNAMSTFHEVIDSWLEELHHEFSKRLYMQGDIYYVIYMSTFT